MLKRRDGTPIDGGTPVQDLILPESVVTLPVHPEAGLPGPGGEALLSPYRSAELIAASELATRGAKRAKSA